MPTGSSQASGPSASGLVEPYAGRPPALRAALPSFTVRQITTWRAWPVATAITGP